MNLLLLSGMVSGMAIARMSQIRTHRRDDAVSLLQHPVTADTVIEKQTKDNKPEPLNLIFSPTAQQVSDEDNKLLELMVRSYGSRPYYVAFLYCVNLF